MHCKQLICVNNVQCTHGIDWLNWRVSRVILKLVLHYWWGSVQLANWPERKYRNFKQFLFYKPCVFVWYQRKIHEELCYQIKEFLNSKQLAPTSILLLRLFTVLCNEHWLSFSYSAIVLAVLLSTLANIKHIPMKIPKLVKNLVGESLYCTYSVQYSQSWPVAPSGVIPKDPHELRDVRATRVIFRISKDDLALSCQGGFVKQKFIS